MYNTNSKTISVKATKWFWCNKVLKYKYIVV